MRSADNWGHKLVEELGEAVADLLALSVPVDDLLAVLWVDVGDVAVLVWARASSLALDLVVAVDALGDLDNSVGNHGADIEGEGGPVNVSPVSESIN